MPTNWSCLLAALCGHALAAPYVDPLGRVLAASALFLLVILARRASPALFVLAAAGAWGGTSLRPAPEVMELARERRVVAAVETASLDREGRAEVWLAVRGRGAQRAWIRDLPAEFGPGSRFFAELDLWRAEGRRNPDDRDPRRSALARRTELRGRVREVLQIQLQTGRSLREGWLARWRDRWQRNIGEGGTLWEALLLGDGRALDPLTRERFARLGLAHLLALSGMHVGIVTGLLLIPLRRWGGRGLHLALPLLMVWAWLAGAGPSLVRAVGMVTWIAVARRLGRPAAASDALATLAMLESLLRPWQLGSLGWWLSYAATLGIVRALPMVRSWRPIAQGVALSCVAQAATLPWALDAFGRLVWAGPAVQLVVGVPFALLLGSGATVWAVDLVAPPLGAWGWPLVGAMAHAFGALLRAVEWASPPAWGHPGFGRAAPLALAAAFLLLPPWRAARRWRMGTVLGLLLLVHWQALGPRTSSWISLDVGQGDGGLYRVGDAALMIDAGPWTERYDPGERVLLPFLRRRNLEEVTLAITHGHLDHYGGAPALLRSGRVTRLVVAATDTAETWVVHLLRHGKGEVELVALSQGDTLWVGSEPAVCLWPPAGAEHLHTNDRSLVLRLGPPDAALLATGDLEREGEAGLLRRLESDASRYRTLKVAHHGGDTGTDAALLTRLDVEWGLISCGRGNRYGHPDPALLDRLRRAGVRWWRTDEQGAVVLRWTGDGRAWEPEAQRETGLP